MYSTDPKGQKNFAGQLKQSDREPAPGISLYQRNKKMERERDRVRKRRGK